MMEAADITSPVQTGSNLQLTSSREEGEISDEENDEDANNDAYGKGNGFRQSHNVEEQRKNQKYNYEETQRDDWRGNSKMDKQHSFENQLYSKNPGHQDRHHARNKRSHSDWERMRNVYDEDESQASDYIEQPVSHSKIWENHRLRRASSVRPRSPLLVSRVRSPNLQDGEDEFLKLMKEHKRIQEQLKSLESEEEKNIYLDQNDEDEKNKFSEEERLLEDIEKLPQSLPESESPDVPLESAIMEMEDISEEEDFDEQELRRLALATSARHNQLIASEVVTTEPGSPVKLGTLPTEKDPQQVVVIPDVDPEIPDPVVVVVEDESTMAKQSKEAGKKSGHKKKKAHGKRKKKDVSKQGDKKSSLNSKSKGNLSRRDWHIQQKVLQVLAAKDPGRAVEKLNKLFRDAPQPPAPAPALTGTMGDFKRQNRLPLLNKTQNSPSSKEPKILSERKDKEALKKKPAVSLQDNYEEVEMDIESDKDENNSLSGKTSSVSDSLQLGLDFTQAMQPLSAMMYTNAASSMYLGTPFIHLPAMTTAAAYQGHQGLSSIPMPMLPPLPPPQLPPLPPSQPPLPPPTQPPLPPPSQPPLPPCPKSPPPPPPPLPPSLPDENMNALYTQSTDTSLGYNQGLTQAAQQAFMALNSYNPYNTHLSVVRDNFQQQYESYSTLESSGARASKHLTNKAVSEKTQSDSLSFIDEQLHQLRKSHSKKEERKPAGVREQGVVDMKVIYDNVAKLRRLATQSIESENSSMSSIQGTESTKLLESDLHKYLEEEKNKGYRHLSGGVQKILKDGDQRKISFGILSKKDRDASKQSDNIAINLSMYKRLAEAVAQSSHSTSGSERKRDGQTRKSDRPEPYQPDIHHPHHTIKRHSHTQSLSSSSSQHPPPSVHLAPRKSPKRRLEASSKEERRRGAVWKDQMPTEYEPESPHAKYFKRDSPPPYIPSSKSCAQANLSVEMVKHSEDVVQERKHEESKDANSDSEDDIDPDFLRKQLLTDMINKRRSVLLEQSNSLDSPAVEDHPTLSINKERDTNTTSTARAAILERPALDDNISHLDRPDCDIEGVNTNYSPRDARKEQQEDEEDSDEDPVPPPVVSRVWNRALSLPAVQTFSSLEDNGKMISPLDDSHTSIRLSHEKPNFYLSPQPSLCDSPARKVVLSSSPAVEIDDREAILTSSAVEDVESVPSKSRSNQESLQGRESTNSMMMATDDILTSKCQSRHTDDSASQRTMNTEKVHPELANHDLGKHHALQNGVSPSTTAIKSPVPKTTSSFLSSLSSSSAAVSSSCESVVTSSIPVPSKPSVLPHRPSLPETNVVVQTTTASAIVTNVQKNAPTHSAIQRTINANYQGSNSNSRNTSPLRERPSDSSNSVNKLQKKHSSMIIPPVHPSVIVPLQTSSDDEEDEEEDVNTTQKHTDSRQAKVARLWEEDQKLCQQKKSILTDQDKLKSLVTKVNQCVMEQKRSEIRSQALAAEIAALMEKKQIADKMAKAHAELRERSKRVAKNVKERLLKNKRIFFEKTKSVVVLGHALMGEEFIPTALQTTQDAQKAAINAPVEPSATGATSKAQQIAAEKHKLKEKEKRIAEKLKLLKETNTVRVGNRARMVPGMKVGKTGRILQGKKSISDGSSDVIRLGKDSNSDMVVTRQRRKSLLSGDSSTTPNLPKATKNSTTKSPNDSMPEDVMTGSGHGEDPNRFKMPSDLQLNNLCKLQKEKVEKVFTSLSSHSHTPGTDPFLKIISLSKGELGNTNTRRVSLSSQGEVTSRPMAYTSPLQSFRSYRFSPFYRTKENKSLISLSHSHKVNPSCIMCPYDLQGKCNDDNCKQQHPKDYTLTEREMLEDFVSYHPQIAGVKEDASAQDIQKGIASYIDSFITKHKGRMALEELCLLLTLEASKVAGKSQSVCSKQRVWRPPPKKEEGLSIHLDQKTSSQKLNSLDVDKMQQPWDKDWLIGEDDVRYFTGEGTEILSLEAGVMEKPQNTGLWLQLSARKLTDPNRPAKECLDQALNILARGLEVNRSSSELWLQYLKLYQRHTQASDMAQFCQMALDYAPSYDLWMLYLSTLKTYPDKEAACRRVLDYLCQSISSGDGDVGTGAISSQGQGDVPSEATQNVPDVQASHTSGIKGVSEAQGHQTSEATQNISDVQGYQASQAGGDLPGQASQRSGIAGVVSEIPDSVRAPEVSGHSASDQWSTTVESHRRSHQVLEMIVYRASLNILAGRFNTGLKFLQFILAVKKSDSIQASQASRLTSLLTSSDHLVLWLVYIHVVEWQRLPPGLMESSSDLPGRIVSKDITLSWSSKPSLNSSLDSLVSLHLLARKVWTRNAEERESMETHYIQLMTSLVNLLVSQQHHSKALSICSKVLTDGHLVDMWILCASLYDRNGDADSTSQTLERGLEANPLNPKIQFYQALYLCNKGHKEKALHLLEGFVLSHFQDDGSKVLDPNMLFCQLLKQDEGFSLLETPLKDGISPNLHKNVFVWMCYCQLLELQGELQETVEVYERSLSHVQVNRDLVLVWQNYISYLVRSGLLSQSWPDILTRSVISSSTKVPLSFSSNHISVVDYRHSNQIINTWLRVLPSSQQLMTVEKCLDFMPGNVALLIRGLELCIVMKETRRAYCWCRMVLAQQDRPSNLGFWKMASALAHREGTQTEIEQFLVGGAECLPLAVSAWKDLLLFEVCRGDHEMVTKILFHCQQLGVNISGFVDTISS